MTQEFPDKPAPAGAEKTPPADETTSAAGPERSTADAAKPGPESAAGQTPEPAAAPEPASAPEPAAAPEPASAPEPAAPPSGASAAETPAPSGGEADAASPSTPDEEPGAASGFGEALEAFERGKKKPERKKKPGGPRVGQKVSGTIVAVTDTHVMVDIGGRSEATAEIAPFRNEDGTVRVAVGEAIELFVVEAGDTVALAPSAPVVKHAGIERMREAHASGMPVSGRVTGTNTGGLQVNLGSVRGFCPMSQIELGRCTEPAAYVGKKLEFVVTSIEASRRSVVLSRRRLLRRQEAEEAKQRLAELKPGDELEGTVRRLEPFGAFVNLGGLDGMVHVSEIGYGRIAHPRDAIHEGEKVRVRVMRIEKGKGGRPRIGLSIKATAPDPWVDIPTRFTPGMRVKGVVARRVDFGMFVTLAPGVDGLVHVSELGARQGEAKNAPEVGEEIEVTVRAVDTEKRRISLTTREPGEAMMESGPPPGRRREPRAGGRKGRQKAPPPVQKAEPGEPPLTTMAIALRKAVEKEREKRKKDEGPESGD